MTSQKDPSTNRGDRALSVREASELYGIPEHRLPQCRADRTLDFFKLGRAVFVSERSLLEFLERHREPAGSSVIAEHGGVRDDNQPCRVPYLYGHRPNTLRGQKAAILEQLLNRRGTWVPAYQLAARALQYSARIKELRDAGYVINCAKRVGRRVHGSFCLVACPSEDGDQQGRTTRGVE